MVRLLIASLAPNRSQVNVPNLYDNWSAYRSSSQACNGFELTNKSLVASIVKNIKPFLTSQLTTLVQTYNDTVNGQSGGSPLVDLVHIISRSAATNY